MDVTSYLLGKKTGGSGGGAEEYFVSELAVSQIYKAIKRLPPLKITWTGNFTNIFNGSTNLEKVDELDISSVTSIADTFADCSNLEEVNLITTSSITSMLRTFQSCRKLKKITGLDTSNVTNFNYSFDNCKLLENIPTLSFSKAEYLQNVFTGCNSLNDEALDKILQACISATSYTGTKTLYYLGLWKTYQPVSRIQALPHYQAFLDAGWTIGY